MGTLREIREARAAAVELITAERARWCSHRDALDSEDLAGDDLAIGVAAYALSSAAETDLDREVAGDTWPWEADDFKPSTPLADLIRAGALLLAEIERRLRAGEEA